MSNGNVKPKRNLRSVFATLAIVCIMVVSCVVPAFAAETGQFIIEVDNQISGQSMTFNSSSFSSSNYVSLYLPNGEPLTPRYFYDNQDYYFEITSSCNYREIHLCHSNGFFSTSDGNPTASRVDFEFISKIIKEDSPYIDSPLGMTTASAWCRDHACTFTITDAYVEPPNPFQDLVSAIPVIFGAWLAVATSVMAWVISEPLAIIGAIGCLIVAGVVLSKKLTRC